MTELKSTRTFDPMRDVPKTDEQAEIALQRNNPIVTQALIGLYTVYRARGESVIEAFRLTLENHVQIAKQALIRPLAGTEEEHGQLDQS